MATSISNSRNVNTGTINSGGGDVHLGDNYYKSVEYRQLTERHSQLSDFIGYCPDPEKRDEFRRQLRDLEREIEAFRREVIRLAEQFREIHLDTDRLRAARDHFEAGRFREARAVLDAEKMTEELDQLLDQRESLTEQLEANRERLSSKANEFLILARLTALDYADDGRFSRAIRYFEASLSAQHNADNLLAYANFLATHNELATAEKFYEELLTLPELSDATRVGTLTTVLNNLGIVNLNREDYSVAEGHFRRSLDIHRDLLPRAPHHYLPLIGTAQNNLCVLFRARGKLTEALENGKIALEVYGREEIAGLEKTQADRATVLNNLGSVHRLMSKFEDSADYHGRALAVHRALATRDPDTYLPDLCATLTDLATLQLEARQYEAAQTHYLESLAIQRRLVEGNPERHRPQLSTLLHNLGVLYSRTRRPEDADLCYLESLEIVRQMARTDPKAHTDDLASALSARSALCLDRNDLKDSLRYGEESLRYYQQLEERHPGQFTHRIATNLACLARAEALLGRADDAERHFTQSRTLLQRLPEDRISQFAREITLMIIHRAEFYRDVRPDRSASLAATRDAYRILLGLTDRPYAVGFLQWAGHIMDGWGEDPNEFIRSWRAGNGA